MSAEHRTNGNHALRHSRESGNPEVSSPSPQFSVLRSLWSVLRSDFFRLPRFPLLTKELTEAAARKRTYVIRVFFAAAMFGIFVLFYMERAQYMSRAGGALGAGGPLMKMLTIIQFIVVMLLTPAMVSGTLAYEKERGTLALLFMTDLRPREILLEKYLGRLIPIFMFMLLTVPLAALSYSMGGVTKWQIFWSEYTLVIAVLQLGAVALAASAYCRTTAGAFLSAYLWGAALYLFLPICAATIATSIRLSGAMPLAGNPESLLFIFPPYLWSELRSKPLNVSLGATIPALLTIPFMLIVARSFLIRRAFVTPKRRMQKLFRWVDQIMKRWNDFVGGIVLVRAGGALPEDQPIHWRETSRRLLGQFQHLFRLLALIEVPLIIIALFMAYMNISRGNVEELSALGLSLWALAVLIIGVVAASNISSERADQTLDVLLTTPISGADIVRQKMRAMSRLLWVLRVPLLTVGLTEFFAENRSKDALSSLMYLLVMLASVLILPSLFAWVAFWIGMKARTRLRTVMTAMIVLILWIGGPPVAVVLGKEALDIRAFRSAPGTWLMLFSPPVPLVNAEFDEWQSFRYEMRVPPATIVTHLGFPQRVVDRNDRNKPSRIWFFMSSQWSFPIAAVIYWLAILWWFRRSCLRGADARLGRAVPLRRTNGQTNE